MIPFGPERGPVLKMAKNNIFGEIFRLKGGGVKTPTTLPLNPQMKYVLFLQFCSTAAVIFSHIRFKYTCSLRLLEIFLNLSDIRSDRKRHHARPGNFLSDKFLFSVENLEFLYRTFGLTRF